MVGIWTQDAVRVPHRVSVVSRLERGERPASRSFWMAGSSRVAAAGARPALPASCATEAAVTTPTTASATTIAATMADRDASVAAGATVPVGVGSGVTSGIGAGLGSPVAS